MGREAVRVRGSEPSSGSASRWGLQRLLDHSVSPSFVIDLPTRRGVFGNAAAATLMGTTRQQMQELLGMDLVEAAGAEAATQIEQSLAALSSGAVRSYRGERSYRDWHGVPIHAEHTVTRLDLCDAAPVAIAVVTRRATYPPVSATAATPLAPAIVTLDHHRRVDVASPDLEPRLGLPPSGLAGGDVFDLIHPDDRQELMAVFDDVTLGEPAKTTMCVRVGHEWRGADLVFAGLCRHRPQRLAALVTLHSEEVVTLDAACPPPSQVIAGATLTVQQQEVVTRLLRGESVAAMAQGMHLSRSTVRNHLSAVYAKAGVHSQAELVARITGRQAVGNVVS